MNLFSQNIQSNCIFKINIKMYYLKGYKFTENAHIQTQCKYPHPTEKNNGYEIL